MEHLLQWTKCSIFHDIFKSLVFQRRQKALSWSKGLSTLVLPGHFILQQLICSSLFVWFGPGTGININENIQPPVDYETVTKYSAILFVNLR